MLQIWPTGKKIRTSHLRQIYSRKNEKMDGRVDEHTDHYWAPAEQALINTQSPFQDDATLSYINIKAYNFEEIGKISCLLLPILLHPNLVWVVSKIPLNIVNSNLRQKWKYLVGVHVTTFNDLNRSCIFMSIIHSKILDL